MNKNISEDFSSEYKIECFDRLAERYYNKNFGTMSKSEVELLMFDFLFEHLIRKNCVNNVLDYNECTDYKISKILGITQQKVSNLKIKKQLEYPVEYEWADSLAALLKNARYNSATKLISINIPDPNLYIEIQNHIEEKDGFVVKSLNRKLLEMRVEYFFELAFDVSDKKAKESIIKELKKHNNVENKIDNDNIGKTLLDIGGDITSIIANIISIANPSAAIFTALKNLIK